MSQKNETISKTILDALIKWFGESSSYDTANERAKLILNEFEFSGRQVTTIRSYIKNNSQIYETKHARDTIFKFMEKYHNHFDNDFVKWYDSKRASRMWLRY